MNPNTDYMEIMNSVRSKTFTFLEEIADIFTFIQVIIKETFSRDFEFKEFFYQCFQIGYKTLPLIAITGTIMGLVLTIQSRPVLADFGAVSMLPGMIAVSLIREMGPVITALICAGKIGSGIGAELSSMKVTEQIDAMELSSTNPIEIFGSNPHPGYHFNVTGFSPLCRFAWDIGELGWSKYKGGRNFYPFLFSGIQSCWFH